MTKSTWLRMVTVASTLAFGSFAFAQSGGGTDPDRDTGSPKTHSKKTTKTTRSTTTQSTATPDDSRAKTPNSQRSRDLENSPGGSDETTVPPSATPPNH